MKITVSPAALAAIRADYPTLMQSRGAIEDYVNALAILSAQTNGRTAAALRAQQSTVSAQVQPYERPVVHSIAA